MINKVKWGFELNFGLDYDYNVIFLLDYFGINIVDQLIKYNDDNFVLEDEDPDISEEEWQDMFDKWLIDNGGDLDEWVNTNVGIIKSKLVHKIGLTHNILVSKLINSYNHFTEWEICPGEIIKIDENNDIIFNIDDLNEFNWWLNMWAEKMKSETYDVYTNVPLFNKKTTNVKLEYNINLLI